MIVWSVYPSVTSVSIRKKKIDCGTDVKDKEDAGSNTVSTVQA